MQQPRRHRWNRPFAGFAGAFLLCAAGVRAQCPDGTPPPCSRGAAAAVKRVNPSLDARAWIVVPFTNVMKAPDLDWLHDASVNLLSLDLGRWTDVRVVPDKRVADLLREIPAPRAASLALSDGIELARRAGAGILVMGDYYRLGKGARLVANVFDVRTGARLRSVERQAADQDSLLTVFGPMARGVLALPPPADARLGAIGTSRIDAYQEYLAGVKALNSFELTSAAKHLESALALDSTFALAHYKLSLAYSWDESASDSLARSHALAALRLAGSLPPRERALVAGRAAGARNEFGEACARYRPLVARDSSDIEALYLLGECSFHDPDIETLPGDSTIGRFRGSWNTSIAAFRRVLDLDPAYHPAIVHIVDALSTVERRGCPRYNGSPCPQVWLGFIVRQGDSLMVEATDGNVAEQRRLLALRERTDTRRANLTEAAHVAGDWFAAAPAEARARYYVGHLQLALGQVSDADATLRAMGTRTDPSIYISLLMDRIEIAVKLGHGSEARALTDSLARAFPARADFVGALDAVFGRLARYRRFIGGVAARNPSLAAGLTYLRFRPLAVAGVRDDSLLAGARAFDDAMRADKQCIELCRASRLSASLLYGWRMPGNWQPKGMMLPSDFRYEPVRFLVQSKLDSMRVSAKFLDSVAVARLNGGTSDEGTGVVATDAYLALGDTVSALRMARFYVDRALSIAPLRADAGVGIPLSALLWPRMMLVRADLAAATGNSAEARVWYQRVLDLWADADPEFQPTLARIRAALASHS